MRRPARLRLAAVLAVTAAALTGCGGETVADHRPAPCVLGLHSDGNADWYCGKPPGLPADTTVVPGHGCEVVRNYAAEAAYRRAGWDVVTVQGHACR